MAIRPTFYAFEIARSAIALNQRWLDVTGQNLANVDTPGYSRQRVVQTALGAGSVHWQYKLHPKYNVGLGVSIDSIQRIRDQFLDRRVRRTNSEASAYLVKDQALSRVEEIFNPIVFENLEGAMADFKKALENLSENADDVSFKALVRAKADSLAKLINGMAKELEDVEADQSDSLALMENSINQIARSLASLNREIMAQHVLGAQHVSNELLDARDLLLDELSGFGNITVTEDMNGGVTVKLGDFTLVDPAQVDPNQVAFYKDPTDPAGTYKFVDANDPAGSAAASAITFTQGSVKGLLDMVNGFNLYGSALLPEATDAKGLPFFINMLDNYAQTLATTFNDLNALGDGGTGLVLFAEAGSNSAANITARNFSISQAWVDDADAIKTTDGSTLGASANDLTRRMAGIFEDKLGFGLYGSFTINEYMRSLITEIANQVQENQRMLDYSSAQLMAVENQRDMIMAVSLNEEGINMAKFQQSYNAAARYMTALDEAVDVIVNRMGIVGR